MLIPAVVDAIDEARLSCITARPMALPRFLIPTHWYNIVLINTITTPEMLYHFYE